MSKKLKIIHKKHREFFGKPKELVYEAYQFQNGKIAYVLDDGTVYSAKDRATIVESLEKQGPVRIE